MTVTVAEAEIMIVNGIIVAVIQNITAVDSVVIVPTKKTHPHILQQRHMVAPVRHQTVIRNIEKNVALVADVV